MLSEDPAVKKLGASAEGWLEGWGNIPFCTRQLEHLCQFEAILGTEAKGPNSGPSCFRLRPRRLTAVELLFRIFY